MLDILPGEGDIWTGMTGALFGTIAATPARAARIAARRQRAEYPGSEYPPSEFQWTHAPLEASRQAEWRRWHASHTSEDFGADPDWLAATEAIYPGSLRLLRMEGCAGLPFLLKPASFDIQLGECKVLRLRPRLLRLAGKAWPDTVAVEKLTAAVLALPDWDALQLSAPTNAAAWSDLLGMNWRRCGLRPYQPLPPAPHHCIRMPGTMDEYLAKFTAKTRKNRLREIRQLAQHGELQLRCYRAPGEIAEFLAVAGELSRRSYQHRLLGAGLPEAARIEPRLQVAALRGWLRAYVLFCGGMPCSFMLGYQYQGRYHYTAIGYDSDWRDRCAGTVLQMMVLQDMFERERPAVFDFGVAAPQKAYFGNEQETIGTLLLFRSRIYGGFACGAQRAARGATRAGARLLEHYQLKSAVQRGLRRLRGC